MCYTGNQIIVGMAFPGMTSQQPFLELRFNMNTRLLLRLRLYSMLRWDQQCTMLYKESRLEKHHMA
jgi:hypothetical protein